MMMSRCAVTSVVLLLILAVANVQCDNILRRATRLPNGPRYSGILAGNDGVTRLGGDLPQSPVKLPAGADSTVCAQMCANTTACVVWSYFKANCGSQPQQTPLCYLKSTKTPLSAEACASTAVINAFIAPPMFPRLPTGSIQPRGWMATQMTLQASGLAGHLQLFWNDIANSSWIGGLNDTLQHNQERMPYWLQGAIAMAAMIPDQTIYKQVVSFIEYILDHQQDDGWLGPTYSLPDNYRDPWPRMPVLFTLAYYHEIVNGSDPRVIPAMYRYMDYLQKQLLTDRDLTKYMWTYVRIQDMLMPVQWLYDNAPQQREQFLMDLSELLSQYAFDWKTYFRTKFPKDDVGHHWDYFSHGVNNGMALKGTAVWYRQSHDMDDYNFNYERTEMMDTYHGLASGIFSCDECLAGKNPSRGSETCTVVEAMFSYETIFSVLGDTVFADRVEQLTFNALPATMDAEMWTHQYLQQTNLPYAQPQNDPWWNTDGGYSNVYGLEPNYGCCTANYIQGWPRYVQQQYMMTQDKSSTGIIVALLGPSQLDIILEDPTYGDNAVHIVQTTNYPFETNPKIQFNISADYAFPLSIRIPGWSISPSVQKPDGNYDYPSAGEIYTYMYQPTSGVKQTSVIVTVQLSTELRVQHRYNDAISLYYGPLLYGLNFPYNMTVLQHYRFGAVDLQFIAADTWQYAVAFDEFNLDQSFQVKQNALPALPFDPLNPPITISAYGRQIEWPVVHGDADVPPQSPINSTKPLVPIQFIPFGSSMLRIAELPYLTSTTTTANVQIQTKKTATA